MISERRTTFRLPLALLLLLGAAPTPAHHSHASLNSGDVRVFEGVVTRYSWRSPHIYIRVDVKKADGQVQEYLIEALNPPAMAALGWAKDTFKPGDAIIWEGAHDRDKSRGYAGVDWAETPDGTLLLAGATDYRKAQRAQDAALENQPVPPVREIGSGNWTRVGEDGGMFPLIRHPATDWPLTEAAATVVANWSEDDNPINECMYGGPPRNILSLSNFQWSRPDQNTIVIDRDMWTEPRIIHLAHDAPKGQPSSYGHSIGRFDGGELHISTDNFTAEVWGMYTGIDSTAQKTLQERYWLSDDGMRLNVEFTVADPGVLTEPFTKTHQWKRVPDRALVKAECSVETAWMYKTAGYTPKESGISDQVAAAIQRESGAAAQATAAASMTRGRRVPYPLLLLVAAAVSLLIVWRLVRR